MAVLTGAGYICEHVYASVVSVRRSAHLCCDAPSYTLPCSPTATDLCFIEIVERVGKFTFVCSPARLALPQQASTKYKGKQRMGMFMVVRGGVHADDYRRRAWIRHATDLLALLVLVQRAGWWNMWRGRLSPADA